MKILEDYCDIFISTNVFEKRDRKNKLQTWYRQNYEHMPDYETLKSFLSGAGKESGVEITYQLEIKVIFPICDVEIFQNHSIDAMKLILLRLPKSLNAETKLMEYKNDYSFNLLKMALTCAPEDIELLHLRYERDTWFYSFSIHEVPCMVLCGMNSADIEQTRGMLSDLTAYQALCEKLGKLDEEHEKFIGSCSSYYKVWIRFLSEPANYDNFAHCMKAHGVV